MAAAISQSCDIPMLIRILASYLYSCPEGTSILCDRQYRLLIDAGTSADDPSAVADSYLRDWWNANSRPADTDNLHYDVLNQALEHHKLVTGKNTPSLPKTSKEKYTWSRDLSYKPQGMTLQCDNCRLYRGIAFEVSNKLLDIRNQVQGVEVKYELHGNMSERRAAGFFQLYEAVLTKELNTDPTLLGKDKSMESHQDKSFRVQELAADELSRLDKLSSLKWTWGTELSTEEAIDIGKNTQGTQRRQHSGYNISLPWGRRGIDSTQPSAFFGSQAVSEIDDDNQVIPELNQKDIPHHFTSFPLRQELDAVPSEGLPRFGIRDNQSVFTHLSSVGSASVNSDSQNLNAANDVFSDSDPEHTSLDLGGDVAVAATIDVSSDIDSDNGILSAAESSHFRPADVFTSDSDADIHIGIHALSLGPESPTSNDSHPAGQVFTSSDSNSEIAAADAFMSSDANSIIPAAGALSDIDADTNSMDSDYTGPLAGTVFPATDPDSDNVAAGDIFSSESDGDANSSPCAANNVFTSSESDSDELQAADVYHLSSDDESGVDQISAILGEQLVAVGPFNPQFFANIPSSWMDPIDDAISDGDGDSNISE